MFGVKRANAKGEEKSGEKKGEAEGRPDSEEMAVSSREEHVPDYLSRCKDIILFAPIVPHFAETLNIRGPASPILAEPNKLIVQMIRS